MAYDGNGTYSPPAPQFPAIGGNTIFAEDFNTIIADLAAALSKALVRDGQAQMLADLYLGGFALMNVGKITPAPGGLTFTGVSTFTGPVTYTISPNVPTKAPGTNTTEAASCAFVMQQALAATVPLQAGNAGKVLYTDGTQVSWKLVPNAGHNLYLNSNFGGF